MDPRCPASFLSGLASASVSMSPFDPSQLRVRFGPVESSNWFKIGIASEPATDYDKLVDAATDERILKKNIPCIKLRRLPTKTSCAYGAIKYATAIRVQ